MSTHRIEMGPVAQGDREVSGVGAGLLGRAPADLAGGRLDLSAAVVRTSRF